MAAFFAKKIEKRILIDKKLRENGCFFLQKIGR